MSTKRFIGGGNEGHQHHQHHPHHLHLGGANFDGNSMVAMALCRLGNNPSPLVPWLLAITSLGRVGYSELAVVVASVEPFGLKTIARSPSNEGKATEDGSEGIIPDPTVTHSSSSSPLPPAAEGGEERALFSKGDQLTPVLVAVLRGSLRRWGDARGAVKSHCVKPVNPATAAKTAMSAPAAAAASSASSSYDCPLAALLVSWLDGLPPTQGRGASGREAPKGSPRDLAEVWRQAMALHDTYPRKLPVGHVFVLLSSSPSASSSSSFSMSASPSQLTL